jgi:RND family efflux transporter MFP subunit
MTAQLRRFAPLVVLAVAGVLSVVLLETRPKASRNRAVREARLVEVAPVRLESRPATVEAMGTVGPAREVLLRPRVAGEVIELAPELIPGGRFKRGDLLLRLDPRDYELTVQQRVTELAEAEAGLVIERGSQDVARREYELLGETVDDAERRLILREPQLQTAQAQVERAKAALAEARLALERTTVRAPFDAIVSARNVEIGTQVDPSTTLATLVGTDAYWVEVSVPVAKLRWLDIPHGNGDLGSAASVADPTAWGRGVTRPGRVIKLLGGVEDEGRMARVLVAVDDPLNLAPPDPAAPLLLLGSFVRVAFAGRALEQVAVLERKLLHEGDHVWLMDAEDRLEIRPVTVAFRGEDEVLISEGLVAGERIVTSALAAPVAGMPLKLQGSEDEPGDG